MQLFAIISLSFAHFVAANNLTKEIHFNVSNDLTAANNKFPTDWRTCIEQKKYVTCCSHQRGAFEKPRDCIEAHPEEIFSKNSEEKPYDCRMAERARLRDGYYAKYGNGPYCSSDASGGKSKSLKFTGDPGLDGRNLIKKKQEPVVKPGEEEQTQEGKDLEAYKYMKEYLTWLEERKQNNGKGTKEYQEFREYLKWKVENDREKPDVLNDTKKEYECFLRWRKAKAGGNGLPLGDKNWDLEHNQMAIRKPIVPVSFEG